MLLRQIKYQFFELQDGKILTRESYGIDYWWVKHHVKSLLTDHYFKKPTQKDYDYAGFH
jgi:hypothetical protein